MLLKSKKKYLKNIRRKDLAIYESHRMHYEGIIAQLITKNEQLTVQIQKK